MRVKFILKQNQLDRDIELSQIIGVPLSVIERLSIGDPDGIRIFEGDDSPSTEEAMTDLYRNLKWLNRVSYFKTLMYTSIYRRGGNLIPFLLKQKEKMCLDYGCGVGNHSILLKEQGNHVTLVDVNGPMLEFVVERFQYRDWGFDTIFTTNDSLPADCFDVALCIEVLEHVFDPLAILQRIHRAMKVGGHLFLRYSTMVKPSSGHFSSNIVKIRKHCIPFIHRHFKPVEKDVFEKL